MRSWIILTAAAAIAAVAGAAQAQRVAETPDFDVAEAVGDVGGGWTKQQSGKEGVTYVCEKDACGGRGVLGVGQAEATQAYIRAAVNDPDNTLKAYKYATDESMRPSGCTFGDYAVHRLSERRVRYDSAGACPEGNNAAMATVFDLDRPKMMSVQVLTKGADAAVKLREASISKIVAALDAPPPAK